MSQTKPYTASEILRYLDGNMSTTEMHAFEKDALADPWLDEAIDGYRALKQRQSTEAILKNLALIQPPQATVSQITSKTPVIPMLWIRRISYAAAGVLLISAGWWLFTLQQPTDPILAPEVAPVILQENTLDPVAPLTDTAMQATVVVPSVKKQQNATPPPLPPKAEGAQTKTEEIKELSEPEEVTSSVATTPSKIDFDSPASKMAASVDQEIKKRSSSKDSMLQLSEIAADQAFAGRAESASKKMFIKTPELSNGKNSPVKIQILEPTDTNSIKPAMGWSSFQTKLAEIIPAGSKSPFNQMVFNIGSDGSIQKEIFPNSLKTKKFNTDLEKLLRESSPWSVNETSVPRVVRIRW